MTMMPNIGMNKLERILLDLSRRLRAVELLVDPKIPFLKATRQVTNQAINAATSTKVLWDTTTAVTEGISRSSGDITVTKSGRYSVDISLAARSASGRWRINVLVNNVVVSGRGGAASAHDVVNGTAAHNSTITLAVNDVVTVEVFFTNATSITADATDSAIVLTRIGAS